MPRPPKRSANRRTARKRAKRRSGQTRRVSAGELKRVKGKGPSKFKK